MRFFKTRTFTALAAFLAGVLVTWSWMSFHRSPSETPVFSPPSELDEELRRLQEEIGQPGPFPHDQEDEMQAFSMPELQDKGNVYVYEIALRGLKPRNLNVQVEKGQLHVEGSLGSQDEGSSITSQFQRSFPLPEDVDADKVQVDTKDDRIIVTLPKKK